MQICVACAAPLRATARFCTQCGTAVDARAVPPVTPEPDASAVEQAPAASNAAPEPEVIPARIPHERRTTRPLERSTAATWALVAGTTPLVVSIVGNLVSAQLGVAALAQVQAGDPQGAWAPVVTVLALVFVGNAALLTVCAICGVRGIRETANGITRGRGVAVAGLSAGGVNLALWLAGLVVTVSGLNSVLA